MLNLKLREYTDWHVKPVMRIKGGYGYRVILKYMDGSQKQQQKSGFLTKKEAAKAREKTIAELYQGSYIVYSNITVGEFMDFWLEEDIKKRVKSHSTYYSFYGIAKNHIKPAFGRKKVADLNRGDIQRLYYEKAAYSVSVAKQVKTVLNISLRYAVSIKVIPVNPAEGIRLPKYMGKKPYHSRNIDTRKTLTMEQVHLLLEKSADTPIHMQVLLNVLMGLRRSEINAVKYSDIDYINRTLTVQRQLGQKINTNREEFAYGDFTKQEIGLKTESSYRILPIPDYVFEAILNERKKYEANKQKLGEAFLDRGYICCSDSGRPRSKSFHWVHYKKLLADNGLPDIRWHDLRSTFCTLLLKNNFNPKAVSQLMGHAKEIITMDVYGDNKGIILDAVPEMEVFIAEVLPKPEMEESLKTELPDTEIDVSEYLPGKKE